MHPYHCLLWFFMVQGRDAVKWICRRRCRSQRRKVWGRNEGPSEPGGLWRQKESRKGRCEQWDLDKDIIFSFFILNQALYSEEDHFVVPLNKITGPALIFDGETLSLPSLGFADVRAHWGNSFLHRKLWRPTFFFSPEISAASASLGYDEWHVICCGLYENSEKEKWR